MPCETILLANVTRRRPWPFDVQAGWQATGGTEMQLSTRGRHRLIARRAGGPHPRPQARESRQVARELGIGASTVMRIVSLTAARSQEHPTPMLQAPRIVRPRRSSLAGNSRLVR